MFGILFSLSGGQSLDQFVGFLLIHRKNGWLSDCLILFELLVFISAVIVALNLGNA